MIGTGLGTGIGTGLGTASDTELAPLSGSPIGVGGLAARARHAASALDDAGSGVRRVVGSLAAERSGAVRAARLWLEDVDARLTTCAEVLGAAASALERHGEVLGQEQGAALRALARRDDALAQVRRHEWELGGAGLVAATWPATPAEHSLLAAQAEVCAAEAEWHRASDAKRVASARAAAVLRGLGDVRALRSAVSSGTAVVDFRDSWLRGQRTAGLLDAAASGAPEHVARERAAVRELLTGNADDPVFWTSFWDTATPQELYLALGPGSGIPPRLPSAELREALAGGVGAWARSASPDELAAFGTAVVDDVGTWPTGLSERAGIAAALLAPTLPAGVHGGAFDALAGRPDRVTGSDLDATAPLWIAVAVGLAAHPRLALDRLAPGDPGRLATVSRLWLGRSPRALVAGGRGAGWPDGGTAVARAFRVAVESGSASDRRTEQARAARLVATATTDLPSGLLSRPLSVEATEHLVRAYDPYLPAFAEADKQPPGTTDDVLLAAAGPRPAPVIQPELDAFALRDVIAATSRTTFGADAWLSAGDRFGDQVAGLATAGGPDADTAQRNDLGYRYLQDVGVIAGSTQAESVSTARQRAADRDIRLGLVGFSTMKSPELVANGVGAVTTALPAVLPDLVGPAREGVLADEPELRHQFAAPLYDAVVAHDVALGRTPEEAEARAAPLDPDYSLVCDSFRGTYTDTSDVRPEQGERKCQGR